MARQFIQPNGAYQTRQLGAWVMSSLMNKIATDTVFDHLDPIGSAVAVHDVPHTPIILGFTVEYIAGLRGINEPTAAIEHRERAFNLIQDRIINPEEALSDDNIGAVVTMVC